MPKPFIFLICICLFFVACESPQGGKKDYSYLLKQKIELRDSLLATYMITEWSKLNWYTFTDYTKFNKVKKVKAVKDIYNSLDIPSLAERKIDQYFTKGFQALDKLNIDPAKKQNLILFAKDLISRQS